MIINFVISLISPISDTPSRADNFLCEYSKEIKQNHFKNTEAIIEFDGLEHAYISGRRCSRSKTYEIAGGFNLPTKTGKSLYWKIIRSAKMSTINIRYGVLFQGDFYVAKDKDGSTTVHITRAIRSKVVRI